MIYLRKQVQTMKNNRYHSFNVAVIFYFTDTLLHLQNIS